jgi:hypothetical protein
MDTSFHATENDFTFEDCGKCLKSRSGLKTTSPETTFKTRDEI